MLGAAFEADLRRDLGTAGQDRHAATVLGEELAKLDGREIGSDHDDTASER